MNKIAKWMSLVAFIFNAINFILYVLGKQNPSEFSIGMNMLIVTTFMLCIFLENKNY